MRDGGSGDDEDLLKGYVIHGGSDVVEGKCKSTLHTERLMAKPGQTMRVGVWVGDGSLIPLASKASMEDDMESCTINPHSGDEGPIVT